MFQSPCGEKVLKADRGPIETELDKSFQSPCGEKVLKGGGSASGFTRPADVSVPLRGKGFESIGVSRRFAPKCLLECFSPLAGKRF